MSTPINFTQYARPLCKLIVAGLALLLIGGCASTNQLRLTSTQGSVFSQQFSHAYITSGEDGAYTIVLTNEPPINAATSRGQTIATADTSPLQQIMVIHVLWRPMRGVKPDHASATNASIDWYITSAGTRHSQDMLYYQGAGYVRVFGGGSNVSIDMRNASVKLAEHRGQLTDPLGSAQLTGSIEATVAPRHVQAVLKDVDTFKMKQSVARGF